LQQTTTSTMVMFCCLIIYWLVISIPLSIIIFPPQYNVWLKCWKCIIPFGYSNIHRPSSDIICNKIVVHIMCNWLFLCPTSSFQQHQTTLYINFKICGSDLKILKSHSCPNDDARFSLITEQH